MVQRVAAQPGHYHFRIQWMDDTDTPRFIRLPQSPGTTLKEVRRAIEEQLRPVASFEFHLGGCGLLSHQEVWLVKEYIMDATDADGSFFKPFPVTIQSI